MANEKDSMESDSSDDDTVSLTSTAASEQREIYVLEAIRCEKQVNGVMKYLVKWEGYDELRDTLEPEEHLEKETLLEWADQKMRITRGLAKSFDYALWEQSLEDHSAVTEKRRKRRRQKRIDLGLPVSDQNPSPQDSSSDENSGDQHEGQSSDDQSGPPSPVWTAKEESTLLDGLNRFKSRDWPRFLEFYGPNGTINHDLEDRSEEEIQKKAVALEKAFEASGKDFPGRIQRDKTSGESLDTVSHKPPIQPQNARQKPVLGGTASAKRTDGKATLSPSKFQKPRETPSSTCKRPGKPGIKAPAEASVTKGPKSAPVGPQGQAHTKSTASPEAGSASLTYRPTPTASTVDLKPAQFGALGRGPSRTDLPVSQEQRAHPSNVMKNWATQPAKVRKSRYERISAGEVQPSSATFKKLSTRRKYELAGRFEHAPDVDSLTFVNLKDPKTISRPPTAIAPGSTARTPFQMLQERLNEVGPPSVPDVADKPILQRAATTGMSVSETGPVPTENPHHEPTENLDTVDPVMATDVHPPPARQASAPLEVATQRELVSEPIYSAPVAVMHTSRDAVKSAAPVERGVTTLPDVRPSQRRNSVVKNPETASKQALNTFSDEQCHSGVALIRPRGVSHTEPRLDPQRRSENKPKSINQRPAPGTIAPGPHRYSLFPLHTLPATQPAPDEFRPKSTDVIGEILTGPDGHSTGPVIFKGLANKDLKLRFLSIRVPPREVHVWCKHLVTAGEYAITFHNPDAYIGSGWIAQFVKSKGAVDKISGMLAEHASGGLFFAENYTLVIYPTYCISWQFLDMGFLHLDVPANAKLRFAMFEAWPSIRQDPARFCHRLEQVSNPVRLQDLPINAVIREHYGMDYHRLVAQSGDKDGSKTRETRSFFLIFPPSVQEEFNLVMEWIHANGGSNIYKHDGPGAWEYFCKTVDKGVVVCHASFFDYWAMPGLALTLKNPQINVFNLSLQPMSPLAPDPHLIRLFPAGMAILLTDSLFLARPMEAARILTWFRLFALPSKPTTTGTWKICTRPAIRDWLLKMIGRLTYPYGRDLVSCYGEIMRLLPPNMTKEWDPDVPKDEAPIACMGAGVSNFDYQLGTNVSALVEVDNQAIVKNDITLCGWFAGWAMMKQEKFRRFQIVTGRDGEDQLKQLRDGVKKWNHVVVMGFEKFATSNNVWNWPKLKRVDEERRAEVRKRDEERAAEAAKGLGSRRSSIGSKVGDVEMKDVGGLEESLFLSMDTSSS
ncbi:MAG: hypothetical protein Q9210_003111 [Variospora velana]